MHAIEYADQKDVLRGLDAKVNESVNGSIFQQIETQLLVFWFSFGLKYQRDARRYCSAPTK
jgi:hypothetical protein